MARNRHKNLKLAAIEILEYQTCDEVVGDDEEDSHADIPSPATDVSVKEQDRQGSDGPEAINKWSFDAVAFLDFSVGEVRFAFVAHAGFGQVKIIVQVLQFLAAWDKNVRAPKILRCAREHAGAHSSLSEALKSGYLDR